MSAETVVETRYAVCLNNDGYPASLEPRKLYEVLADEMAAKVGQVRVIDESGEDYLYPASFFAAVTLPREAQQALRRAS